ncbi:DUF3035 domain-containing protein [Candidatus Pelagibacter sp.]|nr:DUF3035 domain-containing protein [Candidatus Pelagibacter sp.]
MKKISLLFVLLIFLNSCGIIKEGFKNPKKENSDEFLVQKKSPLVMPPDYNELPLPKNSNKELENEDIEIKKLILDKKKINNSETKSDTILEKSLLEQIQNN